MPSPMLRTRAPGSGVQLQDLLGVTPWRLGRTGSTSPGTYGLKAHELVADKLRRYRVALHSPSEYVERAATLPRVSEPQWSTPWRHLLAISSATTRCMKELLGVRPRKLVVEGLRAVVSTHQEPSRVERSGFLVDAAVRGRTTDGG
jgi:hypothetical protein